MYLKVVFLKIITILPKECVEWYMHVTGEYSYDFKGKSSQGTALL